MLIGGLAATQQANTDLVGSLIQFVITPMLLGITHLLTSSARRLPGYFLPAYKTAN